MSRPYYIGRLITSTSVEIMKNHFVFLVGTLGGSRKKIAKKIIPKVETKRNV
ncbi:photosystem II protein H [Iris pallida]|uniref:Photosystem II protein H (Plastid) n=1 Tax=Iris pallida TaxID=29817 RepID=A0AAX6IFW6_IRIPA|nr:photosystem II protein H [Iris pallida]KAJ6841529.1 photosystem II protein H [Iris pallida]KAJ6852112.1 photosystem II protein H [Iris pallida]